MSSVCQLLRCILLGLLDETRKPPGIMLHGSCRCIGGKKDRHAPGHLCCQCLQALKMLSLVCSWSCKEQAASTH